MSILCLLQTQTFLHILHYYDPTQSLERISSRYGLPKVQLSGKATKINYGEIKLHVVWNQRYCTQIFLSPTI